MLFRSEVTVGSGFYHSKVHDLIDLSHTNIDSHVTIYQLLTHTSGIGDDADEEAGEDYEAIWQSKPNYTAGQGVGTIHKIQSVVIMDVVNAEQARIAEQAGAVAVMALERVPSDIRAAGGVARMADPTIVEEVI